MTIQIKDIFARQILDSRGNPTVEVELKLENGFGLASVPSGASTGSFEAVELRDGDYDNYDGKSVLKAVNNINSIIKNALLSKQFSSQQEFDQLLCSLDGTPNKANLGANATLGVSLAFARAVANSQNLPLYEYIGILANEKPQIIPQIMLNVLNGGKHADNSINIQEFMISPIPSEKITSYSSALQSAVKVYHTLKKILKESGNITAVGDEGGFAPNLENDEQALELLVSAIKKAGFVPGIDFKIALDVASSEMKAEAIKLGKPDGYYFWKTNQYFSTEEFINYQKQLVKKYPIFSIEDGLGEEDWENWKIMTNELQEINLVGDDLFVTNTARLKKGIEQNVANSILIKPNQIGTLTETLNAISLAKQNGYKTIISHRSGETDDTFIADLAVGTNAGFIKTGAPCRTDRVSKYNQLLRIEESLPNCNYSIFDKKNI